MIDFLLNQTAIVTPWERYADGEDIYAEAEERPCRISHRENLETTYKNPSGQIDQIRANAKMYCKGEKIPERSLVSCDGEEYVVVKCYRARGFAESHLEVYLQ